MKKRLWAGLIASALSLGACVSSDMYKTRVESRYPAIGSYTEWNDTRLHVIEKGEGAPVLLIHGASANAREYLVSLEPYLRNAPLRLFMADRLGHGYSERPDNASALGVQAEAMAEILNARAEEPAVIVGHSYGGAVALRLALDHPELVKSVVLIAPVTHDWGKGGITWYNSVAATPVIGEIFSQFGPLVGPGIARKSLDELFSPATPPQGYANAAGVDLLFRPDIFRNNARDIVDLQSEIQAQDDRYAAELRLPIVSFSGTGDTVIIPALHSERLKRELPDYVTLVRLDDEGHMPHHGKSELIAGTIHALATGESVQDWLEEKTDGQIE